MIRQRVRIRFRKEDDLRWIGHRDLLRTFERLFRRAELPLSLSEGFHPKPRVSFPSALGLGIQGQDEVMEVELAEHVPAEELTARLCRHAPAGLSIFDVQLLAPGAKKARAERLMYEFPVPVEQRDEVERAIQKLLAHTSFPVQRQGRDAPIDARADLEDLRLEGNAVRICLRVTRAASVRPREILQVLGLADLEAEGYYITRTKVEIASAPNEEKTT